MADSTKKLDAFSSIQEDTAELNAFSSIQEDTTVTAKRSFKDSVFTNLFEQKKYLFQLYKVLHPEDTTATEEQLEHVTIENILTNNLYNDLGFTIGGKAIILVEAQSSWSINIIIRVLLYLAKTYQDYLTATGQDLHSRKKVQIPKPELYVIFTGERSEQPPVISLSEEFFNGEPCAVDVKIKMIYVDKNSEGLWEKDIIQQYIYFTRICNEQDRKYGRTKKAIEETIRICKNENILKEYLEDRKKEVVDIMEALFSQEKAVENYGREMRHEGHLETARRMLEKGKFSLDDIAECTSLTLEEVQELQEELRI